MLRQILNKHNLINSIQEQLDVILQDRYSQWSGEQKFCDPMPVITHGAPGCYQIFYKGQMVYFGTTNNSSGKKTYGLHDRIQKKRTILIIHFNNPDKIRSLGESSMKKALEMGYDMHHSNWRYKFWKLPVDMPLVIEAVAIRQLKAQGYCVLNSDRCL